MYYLNCFCEQKKIHLFYSRSDLVKIGSDQASGHTSGDELETTTSSDIEIISRYNNTICFCL